MNMHTLSHTRKKYIHAHRHKYNHTHRHKQIHHTRDRVWEFRCLGQVERNAKSTYLNIVLWNCSWRAAVGWQLRWLGRTRNPGLDPIHKPGLCPSLGCRHNVRFGRSMHSGNRDPETKCGYLRDSWSWNTCTHSLLRAFHIVPHSHVITILPWSCFEQNIIGITNVVRWTMRKQGLLLKRLCKRTPLWLCNRECCATDNDNRNQWQQFSYPHR